MLRFRFELLSELSDSKTVFCFLWYFVSDCRTVGVIVWSFWLLSEYFHSFWLLSIFPACHTFLFGVGMFYLVAKLSDCWSCCWRFLIVVRIFWLLSEFSDCCQNFLIVVRIFWLLSLFSGAVRIFGLLSEFSDCCQNFLIVVRIFWLLSEFSDCWSCFRVLSEFSDCCQNFLIVVRIFWLLSKFSQKKIQIATIIIFWLFPGKLTQEAFSNIKSKEKNAYLKKKKRQKTLLRQKTPATIRIFWLCMVPFFLTTKNASEAKKNQPLSEFSDCAWSHFFFKRQKNASEAKKPATIRIFWLCMVPFLF